MAPEFLSSLPQNSKWHGGVSVSHALEATVDASPGNENLCITHRGQSLRWKTGCERQRKLKKLPRKSAFPAFAQRINAKLES
jgi:hypothetical protein